LRLVGFDRISGSDAHTDRIVHFFLYDYKFERIWSNPDESIGKLKRYRAVLTPDFSMYLEMPLALQLYNTFRNRWCGAYFASKGIRVIPAVNWGDESTFSFCFDGIANDPETYRFKTISEFKWCMYCHGEVEFVWNDRIYSITHRASGEIGISEAYKQETEKLCKDADEVLEYLVDGTRLREIITQVEVTDRTI